MSKMRITVIYVWSVCLDFNIGQSYLLISNIRLYSYRQVVIEAWEWNLTTKFTVTPIKYKCVIIRTAINYNHSNSISWFLNVKKQSWINNFNAIETALKWNRSLYFGYFNGILFTLHLIVYCLNFLTDRENFHNSSECIIPCSLCIKGRFLFSKGSNKCLTVPYSTKYFCLFRETPLQRCSSDSDIMLLTQSGYLKIFLSVENHYDTIFFQRRLYILYNTASHVNFT